MLAVPSAPLTSRRSGVATSDRGWPARSSPKVSGTPLEALTTFCMSTKLWIGRPSIEVTTSPAAKPARPAALSAWTAATRGSRMERPSTAKTPVMITRASRKLAMGPAATMAARS